MSSRSSIVPSSVAGEDSVSGTSILHRPTYIQLQEASTCYSYKLAEYQTTIDTQNRKIMELTAEIASLRMSVVGKTIDVDTSAEQELLKKFQKCGKYHHLFYRFVVSREMFGVEPPKWASTDRVHYSSAGSVMAGDVAEIYECTPKEYHQLLRTNVPEAVNAYTKSANDARSTALNKVKSKLPTIFPTLGATVFAEKSGETNSDPPPVLSSFPAVQKLLGIRRVQDRATGKWTTQYLDGDSHLLPPVLYEGFDPANAAGLFKNQSLIRIAKAMIGNEHGMWKTSTYRHIDDRTNRTTPGLIAWCGLVAIFSLSDDTTFTSGSKDDFCGHITKRPYLWAFGEYKRYLIQIADKSLFAWWDSHLFSNSEDPADATESISLGPSPLAAQFTQHPNDPLANLVARLTQQSIANESEEEEEEADDFAPPPRRPVSPPADEELSDPFEDNNFYIPAAQETNNNPIPTTSAHAAPLSALTALPSSSEDLPTTITRPSRPRIVTSPSASEFPVVTPPEPAPALAPAKGKKKVSRAKAAAAANTLQAEKTIVPARQTRRSARNT